MFKNKLKPVYFFVLCLLVAIPKSKAWVYPEHRQIFLKSIQNLSTAYKIQLDNFWKEIRVGHENRLTELVINPTQTLKVTQLDFAAWAAIAGDHSCSPENMLSTILYADWILQVANVSANLEQNLLKANTKSKHTNALRYADIQLMRADNEYVSRAGANSVHFLLPRKSPDVEAMDYLMACIAKGAPLNAIGAYAYYHSSALQHATAYSNSNLTGKEKATLMLAALAEEAFALHFLEDAFAAGHAAGSWGNASSQKGTHDYYNENGLELQTWNGKRKVFMGDAYLRNEDAAFIASVIEKSLIQILNAASTTKNDLKIIDGYSNAIDTFNICSNTLIPSFNYDTTRLKEVFILTVIPELENGIGSLPRFRSEIGPFFGVSASLNGNSISGGFAKNQNEFGGVGGLEANLRFGLGLDGVLNQSGDGLMFIQFGWRQDGASSNNFINSNASIASNSIASAIPSRSAYGVRIRLPFYLIPGDLLVASPLLFFTAPKALSKMAVASVNGGLIPWQSGIATGIGRFQFVLGREVGVTFYGLRTPKDFIIVPTTGNNSLVVEYRSTKIDFPIVEYRPVRTFSQLQSSSLIVQISAGVDIPHHANTIAPAGDPTPVLKNVWYTGLRIIFNWRRYF